MQNYISHNHYQKCLENTILVANTRRIQSQKHDLKIINVDKMIYTPFDDKRYLLNDGINSLPFGHYLTEKM